MQGASIIQPHMLMCSDLEAHSQLVHATCQHAQIQELTHSLLMGVPSGRYISISLVLNPAQLRAAGHTSKSTTTYHWKTTSTMIVWACLTIAPWNSCTG